MNRSHHAHPARRSHRSHPDRRPAAFEPLEGRTLLAAQWDHPDFAGNPYVPISAIDATDSITFSRTAGELPFFVQASASAISATGTNRPYEDLEYRWNFGDPAGNEVVTNPADGRTVDANDGQTGPEAAYVYRTAGTYTVTLTVRGRTSGGSYVTQTFTQAVTASAFNGTKVYYDPDAATDGTGTEASPRNVIPSTIPSNQWAFLKRGTVHERTSPLRMSSHSRLSAYGMGADPVIEQRGAEQVALLIANGSSSSPAPKTDIVVSDVTMRNTSSANGAAIVEVNNAMNATAQVANIYFDNLALTRAGGTAHHDVVRYIGAGETNATRTGLWNTRITNTGSGRHGIWGLVSEWSFVVGGHISGAGAHEVLDHHIYPQVRNHSLYRWIEFGAGPGRNYNINTNTSAQNADGTVAYARYHLVADNYMTGTNRAVDGSNGTNNPSINRFTDFVIQGNAVTGMEESGQFYWFGMERVTLRDNVAWNNNGILMSLDDGGIRSFTQLKVYDNLVYASGDVAFSVQGLQQPYVLRNNTVYDTGTAVQAARADLTDKPAGTTVQANRWYAPNDSDAKFLYDSDAAATVTFAQWQAAGFDSAGGVGNPGWLNPAAGDFRTGGSVTGMTLIDAGTDAALGAFANGAVLDRSGGQQFNVRADTTGAVGSIVFTLDGVVEKVETYAPYAVGGDAGGGDDYLPWDVAPGTHTLVATPYSDASGTGTAGPSVNVTFTVVSVGSVTGLTLIDAAADTVIGPLTNGAVVDRSGGRQYNVRADTSGTIGSVVFTLDGAHEATQNTAPYAVGGDNGPDYFAWDVPPGTHTLVATPYGGANGTGAAGQAVTVTFTVTQDPVTVATTDDAYVRGGAHAGSNFNAEPWLMVKESVTADNDRQGYLKFDVAQFLGASSAKLRLFGYAADGAASGTAAVFGVSDTSWAEGGLTWSNRPATSATPLATTNINAAGSANAAWFEWDVTSYVQSAIAAGAQYVAFAIRSTAQDEVRMVFNSGEAANGPQLVVA